jgi:hypothetical protein
MALVNEAAVVIQCRSSADPALVQSEFSPWVDDFGDSCRKACAALACRTPPALERGRKCRLCLP